ncbi:VanZ family protein [Oribacterium sp. WCC10]|uniref:VanZ family protein n=1 Tax=Oribacterium sp. WCC10 TaxID=1855343 RepID=UPI0008EE02F5|nr:VanZ family protein [Oribacterium sp. WCC10]SFG39836.1 VanZ like family protein [Oribacterium sp. WCC10]
MRQRASMDEKLRWFFLFLTVLWMMVIFMMSSQPADESTETSLRVGEAIAYICVPGFRELSPDEQRHIAEMIDHPVRKTAHATEYAILGMFILTTLEGFMNCPWKKKALSALALASMYAATDEIHQLFVPGRSGQISDVMIDAAGAFAGLLILYVSKKIISERLCFRRVSVA